MRSLKGHHFSNFLFNMLMEKYKIYTSIPKKQNFFSEMLKLKQAFSNIDKNQNLARSNNRIITKKILRKFKSPKNLDYHFKYKAPQFTKFSKRNSLNDSQTIDENYFLNNFTNRTAKDKKIFFKEKENELEYMDKYDPKKISNNYIKFNVSQEYSKLSQKLEKASNNENNKEINGKVKMKILKNDLKHNIIEGYFGRKIKTDIPYLFDFSTTFYNNYCNKSEKVRHEVVLNELNKLKAFLINDPKNKIVIFKNFLIKFSYKNIENLSDEQILSICDFICKNDNDILFHLIKPYFKSKDIISDLVNNLVILVKEKKYKTLDNKTLKNDKGEDISNNKEDSLLKVKLNNNIKNKKKISSKNIIKTKKMSQTQNYFYNKMMRETYNSPFYVPFKSHRVLENKDNNKNLIDLEETNSLLKYLNYQKKIHLPNKHYSLDNNSLINEISNEIKELKNNFDKTITNNPVTKFSLLKKKEMSHSSFNNKKMNNDFKILDDKNIFSKTSIQFINEALRKKFENNKQNINIISLSNKNFEKLKDIISNSKNAIKTTDKNIKKLNEINQRMYYKAINYQFGYKQIKDLYKITEIVALNFAKKKKIDKMKLNLLKE